MQPSAETKYDLFVSYRSEDIHIVRPVAEHLMSIGLRVWFAEYEILLSGRERFNEAIIDGINNASYGICFTNDRYAKSVHCQTELRLLLGCLGPDRIVDIRCPHQPQTYGQFPDLRNARAFEYSGLIQALRDIQIVTGYDTQSFLAESPEPLEWHRFSSSGLRYNLDFGGWEVRKHGFGWFGGGDKRVVTYSLRREGDMFYGHLIAGPMDVRRSPLSNVEDGDDRAYYDRALRFADSFYQVNIRQSPVGVHLSFVPGHISQAAFTTHYGPGVIARLYSVVLTRSRNRNDIELAFFFFYRGKINGFLRHAHLMDRLVQSLRVEGQPIEATDENHMVKNESVRNNKSTTSPRHSNSIILSKWGSRRLGKAVLRGDIQKVRDLINRGVNPNTATVAGRDAKGRECLGNPLMVAAAEGLEQIVTELLASGAQVDYTDSRGWTALLFAAENGYKKICELLLNSGANPNKKTAHSGTALMAAAIKGHDDVARLLLERGADASVRDSSGKSALDLASKYGQSRVVSILQKCM